MYFFLEKHHDQFDILISTHGDDELQEEKICHTKLPEDVGVKISTKPKSDVLAPHVAAYKKVYLIEDKASNTYDIKEKIAYHLKRPEDYIIKSLDLSIESSQHIAC